ncbi:uncharacterized protein LOC130046305 isoform X2 [Ostrea edulis]|uniref:uncharacterized protein LOC130046305 isoform X2 n=1 Tax=Ostrea edulis TaxID=37623 RepID=UPI0024AF0837|nr:uncharacterized protein LOC130046305 isoform X2 [Ostrea edulis]
MEQYSVFLLLPLLTACLACTSFPSDLSGQWTDGSTNKGITFQSSGITGWEVPMFNQKVSSWKCVDEDVNQILLSSSPVQIYGLDFVVYRCMKWEKVSSCNYKITFNSNKQAEAGNERVVVLLKSDEAKVSMCSAGVEESRTIKKDTCS